MDVTKGIIYLPIGNPSLDFQPDIRAPGPNRYSNEVVTLNIADGKILWDTPFIAQGSVLPDVVPLDGHDWDAAWGTNLVTVNAGNGPQNPVIGHNKCGDIMAMDAATGKPVWWLNTIFTQNVKQQSSRAGSDVVWPGPGAPESNPSPLLMENTSTRQEAPRRFGTTVLPRIPQADSFLKAEQLLHSMRSATDLVTVP